MQLRDHSKRTHIEMLNQKGLLYIFGMNEPQTNPDYIDLNQVQPVVDLAFDGYSKFPDTEKSQGVQNASVAINGLQTKTFRILSYGNSVGADPQIVVPVGSNFMLWGLKWYVQYNAAGAAAANGWYQSHELKMACPDGLSELEIFNDLQEITTGVQQYHLGSARVGFGSRPGMLVVPAGCQLFLTTWLQDGTKTFPAGTVATYHVYGTALPVGAPIPAFRYSM